MANRKGSKQSTAVKEYEQNQKNVQKEKNQNNKDLWKSDALFKVPSRSNGANRY